MELQGTVTELRQNADSFQPTGICTELKRTTSWSVHYYTSRGSWYPRPERTLGLASSTFLQ